MACSPPCSSSSSTLGRVSPAHESFKFELKPLLPPHAGVTNVLRTRQPRRLCRATSATNCSSLGLQTQKDHHHHRHRHIDDCLSLLLHLAGTEDEDEASDVVAPRAKQIHARAVKSGLLSHPTVGNRLAILYARSESRYSDGSVRRLLDEIPDRTVALYAAVVGLFSRFRRWEDVLSVFALMVGEVIRPDKFLLPKILKACSELQDLITGAVVHGYLLKQWQQLELDVFVGNSLIDMYAKCRDLESSKTVFDTMMERDVVSWTALVTAYAEAGLLDDAVEIFKSMQSNGVVPDLISWNALISGLARNGEIDMALGFLEEMREKGPKPGINSWNGIISGCVQNGCFEDALDLFFEVHSRDTPNAVTIASILPACSGLKTPNLGKGLHTYAIKRGVITNIFVGGSLIDMYLKCGKSDHAESVFSEMENKTATVWNEMIAAYANAGKMCEALEFLHLMLEDGLKPDIITYNTVLAAYAREGQKEEAYKCFLEMGRMGLKPNVVSLNALIAGFQQYGLTREALELFRIMQLPKEIIANNSGSYGDFPVDMLNIVIQPNAVTITSSLSACTDLKLQHQGMEIHGYVLRNYLESNVFVSSALVDMYAKCEDMDSAVKAFCGFREKNTVSWNILMAGHNFNAEPEAALKLFPEMLERGFIPSSITFMILLLACSNTGALSLGRELHGHIVKSISDESPVTVESALIDMYAKCGSILDARLTFNCAVQKDLALWNAIISGYSLHGMAKEAISLFEQMERSDFKPDHITFTAILSACRQEGFVQKGWGYFNSMEDVYGIIPTLEHFTCMIGIMGGAGLLEDALDFIRRMPFDPDACVWATLLRACRMHSNYEIGERAAMALFELEPRNTSNYIVLSNIYAMAGMWDAAMNVRISMRAQGLKAVTTRSWIYIGNTIHTFKAGESSHPELEKILEAWDRLAIEMERSGYVPQDPVFHDEDGVDPLSCFHTEKLAICFGIISSHARGPIRVSKNVRMCIDCHTSVKLISKIDGREVFVKDGCFYHHFKDGTCSCRDKW